MLDSKGNRLRELTELARGHTAGAKQSRDPPTGVPRGAPVHECKATVLSSPQGHTEPWASVFVSVVRPVPALLGGDPRQST